MDGPFATPQKTFIEVAELWVPTDGVLALHSGSYGPHKEFEELSGCETFAKGAGLPGKAWDEARPVVLKAFEGSYFRRTEAAHRAGLTSAVALPVFNGKDLKAVLVVFCADDDARIGAIEVWKTASDLLGLDDGYYGAAEHFEWVSRHSQFPRGQGLPGGVLASATPLLMRNLGSSYGFVRSESAGQAGLTMGLGMPVPTPTDEDYVVTLLSARGTPIAQRFEIWDARKAKVGTESAAVLIDGICAKEGALWDAENPRKVSAWMGHIGKVIGSGLPVLASGKAVTVAGYDQLVALPIYQGGNLSHVVAWYC
ncbi:MAG: GAF domain-containing protein [Pseudomonadota bacterium]